MLQDSKSFIRKMDRRKDRIDDYSISVIGHNFFSKRVD